VCFRAAGGTSTAVRFRLHYYHVPLEQRAWRVLWISEAFSQIAFSILTTRRTTFIYSSPGGQPAQGVLQEGRAVGPGRNAFTEASEALYQFIACILQPRVHLTMPRDAKLDDRRSEVGIDVDRGRIDGRKPCHA
jgi:hypothetical protein